MPATRDTGGKAIPYGGYYLQRNEGVSLGIDHDTATFAVNNIRRWWQRMGWAAYRQDGSLLVTPAAGDGTRLRLWKWGVAAVRHSHGSRDPVYHFPLGTSSGVRLGVDAWHRFQALELFKQRGVWDLGEVIQRHHAR